MTTTPPDAQDKKARELFDIRHEPKNALSIYKNGIFVAAIENTTASCDLMLEFNKAYEAMRERAERAESKEKQADERMLNWRKGFTSCREENAELKEKLARAESEILKWSQTVSNCNFENAALRTRIEKLREALVNYAGMPMRTTDGSQFSYDSNSFENDRGKRARETLTADDALEKKGE